MWRKCYHCTTHNEKPSYLLESLLNIYLQVIMLREGYLLFGSIGIAPKRDCTQRDCTHGIAPARDCTHTELHPHRIAPTRDCTQRYCTHTGLHPHGIAPIQDCTHGIAPTQDYTHTKFQRTISPTKNYIPCIYRRIQGWGHAPTGLKEQTEGN